MGCVQRHGQPNRCFSLLLAELLNVQTAEVRSFLHSQLLFACLNDEVNLAQTTYQR